MKNHIVVGLSFTPAEWSTGQAFFRSIGRPELSAQPLQEFGYTLDVNSEQELEKILKAWSITGLEPERPFVTWTRKYSSAELSRAPLLNLIVTEPESGEGGPRLGTQYDLGIACPRCGTGARQKSALVLDQDEVPARGEVGQTLHGELLLSSGLAGALADAGVNGAEYWSIDLFGKGQVPGWVQLLTLIEMPPLSAKTKGILRERPCPQCGRDGYFQSAEHPQELVYDRMDLEGALVPDVAFTWERFGNSRLTEPISASSFARPLLLVSPRVQRIFQARKVRGVEFIPVEIVG